MTEVGETIDGSEDEKVGEEGRGRKLVFIEVLSKGGHRVSLVGLPFRQGFCLDNLEKDGHGTPKGLGTNSFGC